MFIAHHTCVFSSAPEYKCVNTRHSNTIHVRIDVFIPRTPTHVHVHMRTCIYISMSLGVLTRKELLAFIKYFIKKRVADVCKAMESADGRDADDDDTDNGDSKNDHEAANNNDAGKDSTCKERKEINKNNGKRIKYTPQLVESMWLRGKPLARHLMEVKQCYMHGHTHGHIHTLKT